MSTTRCCYQLKVNTHDFGEIFTFDKEADKMLDSLETTFPKEELKAKWYEKDFATPIIASQMLLEELLRKTKGAYALAVDLEDVGFSTSKFKKVDMVNTITTLEKALDYCNSEVAKRSVLHRIYGENHIRLVRNKLTLAKRIKRNVKILDRSIEDVLL